MARRELPRFSRMLPMGTADLLLIQVSKLQRLQWLSKQDWLWAVACMRMWMHVYKLVVVDRWTCGCSAMHVHMARMHRHSAIVMFHHQQWNTTQEVQPECELCG